MFSRKKYTGNVRILEDDDQLDRSTLFEGKTQTTYVRDSEHTNEELNDALLREAQFGKLETERALRSVIEARDTGKEVAISLHTQTKQLEKNSEELSNIHDKLDEAELLVHKIKTPKLLRMFRRKPKSGRGLKNTDITRAEKKEREKLREKGVQSINLPADEAGAEINDDEGERKDILGRETESKRRNLFGRDKKPKPTTNIRDIHEDYSEYEEPVRNALIDQDKNLEVISDVVRETSELAKAMSHEIALQEGLIDQVQSEVHATKERTSKVARSILE